MDAVARDVKQIIGNAAWRAYGGRLPHPEPVCAACDGDGCERCDFTGDPPGETAGLSSSPERQVRPSHVSEAA